MRKAKDPERRCERCDYWKERKADEFGRLGWCDYRYPELLRGIRRPDSGCRYWKAREKVSD